MTSQQEYTKLKQYGINPDFALNKCHYESCPGCAQDFSYDYLPILLECGHLICENCIVAQAYVNPQDGKVHCFGLSCGKPMVAKQKKFMAILDLTSKGIASGVNKQQKVDFLIKSQTGMCQKIKGISLNTLTFEQLLGKHITLLQRVHNKIQSAIQELQFVINGKGFLYREVKNMKVKDKVNIWSEGSSKMNLLFLYDRKLGGK